VSSLSPSAAWFASLKGRLSVAIVAGVLAAVAIVALARGAGAGWPVSSAAGTTVALVIVLVLARGTTRPLRELSAAARAMAAGDYTARVGTSSVTEIAQLEHAFNEMAAELAQVDRFRRDLVANASHELRTPIAVLRASLENLVDGVAPSDPERLTALLGQVERLGRLTEQLLDLSTLESGSVPLVRAPFPAERVVRGTAEALAVRADGRRITVEIIGEPVIIGDETRIGQVVTNLVENALRHAPPATDVEVTVAEGPGTVSIEVADAGPGIPAEQVDRVFERFQRLDPSRRRGDGGAGLGLSIVRWIVELHGGRIDVVPASPDGRGCRMVVALPGGPGAATADATRRGAGRSVGRRVRGAPDRGDAPAAPPA
jgi:signal transduction histidine kinase